MSTNPIHTFPGLQPFIERAGAGRDLPHLGRSCSLWHCKQVQDALGQLPRLDRESRNGLLAHLQSARDALAVVVEGIDLAVKETTEAIDRAEGGAPERPSPRRKRP